MQQEISQQVQMHFELVKNQISGKVREMMHSQEVARDHLLERFVPQGELANVRLEV